MFLALIPHHELALLQMGKVRHEIYEHSRFLSLRKTCEPQHINRINDPDRYCRYHFYYKFAKKGKSADPILPLIT